MSRETMGVAVVSSATCFADAVASVSNSGARPRPFADAAAPRRGWLGRHRRTPGWAAR
jgi:hypothetical protein